MKKISIVIGIILLSIVANFLLAKYYFTIENKMNIAKKLEITIPVFSRMEEKDSHGGFLGDGEALVKIYLSKDNSKEIIEQMEKNSHWRKLPLSEDLKNFPVVDKEYKIPDVQNGYWFVYDRYYKAIDQYDAEKIFDKDRSAFNFSLAVFDTDSNILYYFEEDT